MTHDQKAEATEQHKQRTLTLYRINISPPITFANTKPAPKNNPLRIPNMVAYISEAHVVFMWTAATEMNIPYPKHMNMGK